MKALKPICQIHLNHARIFFQSYISAHFGRSLSISPPGAVALISLVNRLFLTKCMFKAPRFPTTPIKNITSFSLSFLPMQVLPAGPSVAALGLRLLRVRVRLRRPPSPRGEEQDLRVLLPAAGDTDIAGGERVRETTLFCPKKK